MTVIFVSMLYIILHCRCNGRASQVTCGKGPPFQLTCSWCMRGKNVLKSNVCPSFFVCLSPEGGGHHLRAPVRKKYPRFQTYTHTPARLKRRAEGRPRLSPYGEKASGVPSARPTTCINTYWGSGSGRQGRRSFRQYGAKGAFVFGRGLFIFVFGSFCWRIS